MASTPSDYRPTPSRSINVIGEFSEELAESVIPEVLKLREESLDPVSVYIHSRGGYVDVFEAIEAALRTPNYDGNASRIITTAVGDVSSAAANLLALGDYAIAYPESRILYHGIRVGEVQVTFEGAQNMAGYLGMMNRRIARRISICIFPRIMFRFFQLRSEFPKTAGQVLSPVDSLQAFRDCIDAVISAPAQVVLKRACKRVCDAHDLTTKVFSRINIRANTNQKIADAKVVRAVLKHELETHKEKDWRLDESGMNVLIDHYFMMREFNIARNHTMFHEAVRLYGAEFLNKADSATYKTQKETDKKKAFAFLYPKAYQYIALLWFYAVTLSHNLFVGENHISAGDSYWLGIIDEVKGAELPCERSVMEEQEKKANSAASNV